MKARAHGGGVVALALGCAGLSLQCGSFGEAQPVAPDATVPSVDGGPDVDAAKVCPPDLDFTKDPKNCGRCGRDCGGGACEAGACRSYVLVDSTARPWYIAVDDEPDGSVYWTSYKSPNAAIAGGDGAVRSVPKRGGPVAEVAPPSADAYDVAVQGDRVVFTSVLGNVMSVRRGEAPTPLWPGRGVEITRSGTSLFFTSAVSPSAGIFEVTPTAVVRRATFPAEYDAEGIAVDGTHIFWANHIGLDGLVANASVGKVQRDGANPENEWTPSQSAARRIGAGGGYVYWTSNYLGTVSRRPVTGGSVEQVLGGNVRYGAALVDAANGVVYITAELDNTLLRGGLEPGAQPIVIESGLDNPVGLAQDATAIYFTERNGNRIRRLVK